MPTVTETTTIPSPTDKVWPLLRDPALVASCIPGATLSPDQGDGMWRGSIRVKFGPTVAVFRGEASLAFDDAAMTCTIEGRGIDGRGASRALASGLVKVSGSDRTRDRRHLLGERAARDLRQRRRHPRGARPARRVLGQHGEETSRANASRSDRTHSA
jgi:carbon monoxide dehydrogenase subunit G